MAISIGWPLIRIVLHSIVYSIATLYWMVTFSWDTFIWLFFGGVLRQFFTVTVLTLVTGFLLLVAIIAALEWINSQPREGDGQGKVLLLIFAGIGFVTTCLVVIGIISGVLFLFVAIFGALD